MNNTPTPRTDEAVRLTKVISSAFGPMVGADDMEKLEQELNEVKEYAAGQRVLASAINDAATEMVKERDQLRKVVDELCSVVRGEFGDSNWRVNAYSKLPRVIERKTK